MEIQVYFLRVSARNRRPSLNYKDCPAGAFKNGVASVRKLFAVVVVMISAGLLLH